MSLCECVDLYTLVTPGPGPGPAHHVGHQDHEHHARQCTANDDRDHVGGTIAAVRRHLEHAVRHVGGSEGVKLDTGGCEVTVGQLLPGITSRFWK